MQSQHVQKANSIICPTSTSSFKQHPRAAQSCLGAVQLSSHTNTPPVPFQLHQPPWSYTWWSVPTYWLRSLPLVFPLIFLFGFLLLYNTLYLVSSRLSATLFLAHLTHSLQSVSGALKTFYLLLGTDMPFPSMHVLPNSAAQLDVTQHWIT